MEAGKNLRASLQKIPVRIVQTQDIHGNKKVGVMLDIQYYQNEGNIDPGTKVKAFKELYFDAIKEAKKLYSTTKAKDRNSTYYWKLSDLLRRFNKKTESEFEITNYLAALQRDFGLTDSYVGIMMNFSEFFEEREVSNKIPFNVYFELMRKKRKLERLDLFEAEKERLLQLAKRNESIPKGLEYRKYLASLTQQD
jgi:hypothetical protein